MYFFFENATAKRNLGNRFGASSSKTRNQKEREKGDFGIAHTPFGVSQILGNPGDILF